MIAMRDVSARLHLCLVLLLLSGCGAGTASTTTTIVNTANNLAGNWLLYGSLPQVTSGFNSPGGLAASFDVIGDQVVGSATFLTTCGSGGGLGATFGTDLTGTIAPDGTFTVSFPTTTGSLPLPALTISGSVPPKAGAPWSGTYTFQQSDQFCKVSQTATFTASPVADVTGTYSGTGALPGAAPGSFTLSLTSQQGAPLYSPLGITTAYSRLGLSGSIQIQGISCFSKGVTGTTLSSTINGSEINANFVMDDGSALHLTGSVVDTTADHLQVGLLLVSGGNCNGNYLFGLNSLILSR